MPLEAYKDLNPLQLDLLKELGNIGSGNAVTALSQLLSKPVNMAVSKIRVLDFEEVTQILGGPEEMIVGALLTLNQDVTGMIMFLLQKDFAHTTLNALLGREENTPMDLGEMEFSVMSEVANILAASYVTAISELTGLRINISVPSVCIDMAGSILSVPAIHYANISDNIIFIEDEFSTHDQNIYSRILMIPDVDSLNKIMDKLGMSI